MFEDLWGDVALFVRDFQSWSPSSTTHYTIIFVSVLAAVVLSRIVAGTPVLIGPLSFAILYLMAMVANFAGHDFRLTGATDLHMALIYTVLSQSIGAVLILLAFRTK